MSAARHALITGGSSGIGLACARLLATRGYCLSLVARDARRLNEAVRSIRLDHAEGVAVHGYSVDVADAASVAATCARIVADVSPPMLVVMSAGVAKPGYFAELAAADFEHAMAVNYFGALNVVRALLPAMRTRGAGHLVFVSSGAGLVGIFGYSAYAPSKFAVRGLAEVLRAELAPEGIGVSIVYPPDTDTPQLAAEAATKPVETRAIAAAAGTMSAERVARAMLAGIDRKRFVIAPGIAMSALARFHSSVAPWLNLSFDRRARRAANAERMDKRGEH
jgi:3-dehydrosphinganine reductase